MQAEEASQNHLCQAADLSRGIHYSDEHYLMEGRFGHPLDHEKEYYIYIHHSQAGQHYSAIAPGTSPEPEAAVTAVLASFPDARKMKDNMLQEGEPCRALLPAQEKFVWFHGKTRSHPSGLINPVRTTMPNWAVASRLYGLDRERGSLKQHASRCRKTVMNLPEIANWNDADCKRAQSKWGLATPLNELVHSIISGGYYSHISVRDIDGSQLPELELALERTEAVPGGSVGGPPGPRSAKIPMIMARTKLLAPLVRKREAGLDCIRIVRLERHLLSAHTLPQVRREQAHRVKPCQKL